MSQDLKQYADIIEQLKPMVNEPEFNQVLLQTASDVPKEKRFLIKMEVKRLAKPCMRMGGPHSKRYQFAFFSQTQP